MIRYIKSLSRFFSHILFWNVCVCPWWWSSWAICISNWNVEEIPNKYCVVMGTADNLEFVKLQPEHAARMFLHWKWRKQTKNLLLVKSYSTTNVLICLLLTFILFELTQIQINWQSTYSILVYTWKIQCWLTAIVL